MSDVPQIILVTGPERILAQRAVEESARTAVTDGHAWTAEADEELREGIGMGLTLDELADHLEMSEDAVVARCEQLGLRPQGS